MQSVADHEVGNVADTEYSTFMERVRSRFASNAAGKPVFQTTASQDLAELYLDMFPPQERQHHNCNACIHFLHRYGALVTIDPETGLQVSAMWDEADAPEQYRRVVWAMAHYVGRAAVTGPFLSADPVWGHARTGIWQHFSVANQARHRHALLTAGQVMAERREDFKNVQRALQEFPAPVVNTAVSLLEGEDLYRSEKVLGAAKWLQQLHADLNGKHGRQRNNIVWHAVATAPAGFAHPRSSMIGTLLVDIADGSKSYSEIERAFKAKMHPLQYQRPQATPSAGAVAQAERTFEAMGAAAALQRRIARVEEVQALWRKPEPKPATRGVFGYLVDRKPAAPTLRVPRQEITFEKFRRTVLGDAKGIEVLMPVSRGNFRALVTAVDPDAPPLLQWDDPERRNPVNSYVWHGGSTPHQWGLNSNTWVRALALCLNPAHWFGGEERFAHQVRWAMFILEGARESRSAGLALFPETLRSELHGVRSVIEAHSRSQGMQGLAEGSACGLEAVGSVVRVTDESGTVRSYRIDRWD